tara:strand:- start:605 stop:910 length:306 start_codon:yes stop_codon:yes gene_type:complete
MAANIFGSSEDVTSSYAITEASTIRSGRTRVYGVYLDSHTTAGDIVLRDGGASGTIKFQAKTPAIAEGISIEFPGAILFGTDVHCAFTTEHIVAATVFHSK